MWLRGLAHNGLCIEMVKFLGLTLEAKLSFECGSRAHPPSLESFELVFESIPNRYIRIIS
jgi:hypothetical protein